MKVLYNDGHVDECPAEEVTHVVRHSAAHIMAQAIKRLYPEADFAYGPATDNGFYYDIDLPEGTKISEEDFPAIEAEMKKIVKENLKFTVFELPREEAVALMQERGEKYKVEHIGDLPEDARITFYQQGEYIDMCVGPHLTYTKALKAFKLTGVDAHPRERHRLRHEGRARGAPAPARGGQEARPPQDRSRDGHLHDA